MRGFRQVNCFLRKLTLMILGRQFSEKVLGPMFYDFEKFFRRAKKAILFPVGVTWRLRRPPRWPPMWLSAQAQPSRDREPVGGRKKEGEIGGHVPQYSRVLVIRLSVVSPTHLYIQLV